MQFWLKLKLSLIFTMFPCKGTFAWLKLVQESEKHACFCNFNKTYKSPELNDGPFLKVSYYDSLNRLG